MKLSTAWLQADFGLNPEADELARRLTMAGLEVDAILPAAGPVTGVVVGEVRALLAHPNADKLRIAQVATGGETLQIVCGAANVAQGVKVAVAPIGATLPGGVVIEKARLRGVDSFGMLCSARELGMGEDHDGLLLLPEDAPLGEDITASLSLGDRIIDLDLTPNRGDAFSMRGLARETALLLGHEMPETVAAADAGIVAVPADGTRTIAIDNQAPADCPVYLARVIDGLDNRAQTPLWLRERLRRAGVRTHDPLVDVTNYVMLLLGTPMHPFDGGKIAGALVIRRANAGEKLRLINDDRVTLNDGVLVIADREKALAIAGVMGGADSACSMQTTRVVLESAWFDPLALAGTASRFGVSSDSAQRFERGVDYTLQSAAIELATRLILDICGGSAGPVEKRVAMNHLPTRAPIVLHQSEIARLIGRDYQAATVAHLFTGSGCGVQTVAAGWEITPPSWRFDLAIAADLIEEITRIDGYHNVPDVPPQAPYQKDDTPATPDVRIGDLLTAHGFREAITYSFLDRASHKAFFADREPLTLCNPISAEMAEMRLGLLPGLVNTLLYNRNRQQTDVRLFELGTVFHPRGETVMDCIQRQRVAGVMSGLAEPEQWCGEARMVDFFDLKGVVEALLEGVAHSLRRSDAAYLHPGRSAQLLVDARPIGVFGALHPRVLRMLGGKGGDIWVFEFDSDALSRPHTPTFVPIGRFPAVRRDLALLVDRSIGAGELEQAIRAHGGGLLRELRWFDAFTGTTLPPGKKSLAVSLTFQSDEKTLQDEDVDGIIDPLVHLLCQTFGAELR